MTVFIARQVNGEDSFQKFDGMDEKQVMDMFEKDGISFEFINKEDYEARIAAIPPRVIPPPGPSLEDRITALELKVSKIPIPET